MNWLILFSKEKMKTKKKKFDYKPITLTIKDYQYDFLKKESFQESQSLAYIIRQLIDDSIKTRLLVESLEKK